MASGFWGKKIGMTQFFKGDKAVPATAIDPSNWVVTQIKTDDKDGYQAVQVGYVKDRHQADFSKEKTSEWLKSAKRYFAFLKEIKVAGEGLEVGDSFNWASLVQDGSYVDVFGRSIGKGYAGGMKRHGFKGGRGSHGDKLGRKPGSMGFMRKQGRVIKGKKLPGHAGYLNTCVKSLEILKFDPVANVVLVKGAVPGKSGSLLFVRNQG